VASRRPSGPPKGHLGPEALIIITLALTSMPTKAEELNLTYPIYLIKGAVMCGQTALVLAELEGAIDGGGEELRRVIDLFDHPPDGCRRTEAAERVKVTIWSDKDREWLVGVECNGPTHVCWVRRADLSNCLAAEEGRWPSDRCG